MDVALSDQEKRAVEIFAADVRSFLGANLREIRLFGSRISGIHRLDSDIDILVVVCERKADLRSRLVRYATEAWAAVGWMGGPLAPKLATEKEIEDNRDDPFSFLSSAAKGIAL